MSKQFDVIIIGGGLTGLTSAFVCQQFGYKTLVLEKSSDLGGGNKSFADQKGNIFDFGYHALDSGRSSLTTNFFKKILKNKFKEIELKRGIAIENNIIPYNSPLSVWPDNLKKLFKNVDIIDDTTHEISIKHLEEIYGKEFLALVTTDILRSYPHKKWSLDKGATVEDHIDYVYPWFFPKFLKKNKRVDESGSFHDEAREKKQFILYPSEGGFDEFLKGIVSELKDVKILKNCKNLELKKKQGSDYCIESVAVAGEDYTAPILFWCAPITSFYDNLKIKFNIEGVPQKIIVGSFETSTPLSSELHEILVGSSNHLINRISFPGNIRGQKNNLVQVEFYFPIKDFNFSAEEWQQKWTTSLQELNILKSSEVSAFDFREEIRGFVTKESFEKTSSYLKSLMQNVDTNLILPFPMVGPENINRLIPQTILNVTSELNKLKGSQT